MPSTVSPRIADPALRLALVESAARLIAEEGARGLHGKKKPGAKGKGGGRSRKLASDHPELFGSGKGGGV